MFFLKCADVFLGGRWAGVFYTYIKIFLVVLVSFCFELAQKLIQNLSEVKYLYNLFRNSSLKVGRLT